MGCKHRGPEARAWNGYRGWKMGVAVLDGRWDGGATKGAVAAAVVSRPDFLAYRMTATA